MQLRVDCRSEQADPTLVEVTAKCDFDIAEMVNELNQALR